ncbi:MAG: DUF1799 domain-containing protein [Marinobacterium sp.]|nr:DUF1799 domain-containing protein [Marinobacterium sp.]
MRVPHWYWQAYQLYCLHSTQWRLGPSGPGGLDYSVIYQTMDRMKLDNDRQLELISEIGLIESGIRAALADRQEKGRGRQ